MKICITSQGKEIDSQIDPRFGRCAYFIFADTETGKIEAVSNEFINASGGAGTKAAQFIAGKGALKLLTGNLGPNAVTALSVAGIATVTGVTGTVKYAIDKYKV